MAAKTKYNYVITYYHSKGWGNKKQGCIILLKIDSKYIYNANDFGFI